MFKKFDRYRVYVRTYNKGWDLLLKTVDETSVFYAIDSLNPNECESYIVIGHYDDIDCDVAYLSGRVKKEVKKKRK